MSSLKYLLIACLLATHHAALAGWQDFANDLKASVKAKTTKQPGTHLSQETIATGLKQALNQGIDKSVKQLGKPGGFTQDATVKIPMPKALKKVDKGLRKINQGKVADKFIHTMNQAAEKAVPKTVDILVQAVKAMTLKDALNILNGKPDAATQYFKRTSTPHLRAAIKPIVKKATSSVGLTSSYKKMMAKAGFLARYVDKDSLDIDEYITDKAIDGLFVKIALEEKRIRDNPLARTTDILKQVFAK